MDNSKQWQSRIWSVLITLSISLALCPLHGCLNFVSVFIQDSFSGFIQESLNFFIQESFIFFIQDSFSFFIPE